jgi:16S rRNA (cytosine1402-N4)-methyltransferase
MSKDTAQRHIPVALDYAIEMLAPALDSEEAVLVDGTLGLGGHSEAFLEAFPRLTVVGIDRDLSAIELASERLARFGSRVKIVHSLYSEIQEVLDSLKISKVDAILLDLGVSSMQLDEADRGFAYSFDSPLDMRMNQHEPLTAAMILNQYSEGELARIFKEYGEERHSKKIARAIIDFRKSQEFTSSAELASLISKIIPFIPGKSSGHPAKRVFQALRIEVNAELDILGSTIPSAISTLRVGGRILVMSYHSLEDTITKVALSKLANSSAPIEMPVELPEHAPSIKMLTKGTVVATDIEKQNNPRSASVRMRAAEKIRDAA